MNLNEAEIAVTTKRLVTVNPKKSYRMELGRLLRHRRVPPCLCHPFPGRSRTRIPLHGLGEHSGIHGQQRMAMPELFRGTGRNGTAGRVSAGLFRAVVRTLRLQPGDGRSAPARILLSGQSPCTDGCAGGGRTRCGGGKPGLSGYLFLLFIRDELPI
ncbi:hypothetical protein IMSAGC001_03045 [Bacteroides acidifaciens]|uniref:Uncharacterized protein n=1 Tax=Bacteroides acidifaciens TaxID=85831 RepID=A0A7J0A5Q5_9BACE|nr:hypothetical protein IMSAGC001_03045 [Bacteroides acidifaciens]